MTYQVVYSTDEDYLIPTYVSIYSLIVNNENKPLEITVLTENKISGTDEIKKLSEIGESIHINIVEVDDEQFQDLPEPGRWSTEIYHKLYIDELVDLRNDYILWLDSDIIIDGDLIGLFETDLDERVAGAVPHYKNKLLRYNLPIQAKFYKTGLLYINIKQWKDKNIKDRVKKFIENNPGCPLPELVGLNHVIHEEDMWEPLHPIYDSYSWESEMEEANIEPKIIHFAGGSKPWKYRHINRKYGAKWWDYLDNTQYSDFEPEGKTLKNTIGKELEKFPLLHEISSSMYRKYVE